MLTPDWLRLPLAAALVAVTLVHGFRLAARRAGPGGARVREVVHAVTAAAMTAMLVGAVGPNAAGYLALAFAVPAAWWTWHALAAYVDVGGRDIAPHADAAVGCAAMAFLFGLPSLAAALAPAAMPTMAMPSDRVPGALAATAVVLVMATLATSAARFVPLRGHRGAPVSVWCGLTMNAATVAMLAVVMVPAV